MTTSSGKHLEDNSHAHIVSLMYKLVTSDRASDDLSSGSDRSRDTRQRVLTNNENQKGKYHVRIYLKCIFGTAEHQEKATYGLVYKLTLTRNTDNTVLNKDHAISIGKINTNAIQWYLPHHKPSISVQAILSNQILSQVPKEL